MKKAFFCDIDGTILDGSRNMKDVSDKTRYAINELSKDNYVFIASGRCKGLLAEEILSLNTNGYVLCNGAYAEVNGKQIYADSFDDEAVKKIIECSLGNNGFYVLETLNDMYVNDLKASQFIKFLNGWGTSLKGFKQNDDINKNYHIAMVGFASEEDCLKCEKDLGPYVKLGRHHGFMSYDVNINGVDKGYGVKKVLDYLNIDIENSYCFGDGINDLEMLQTVGHPVIMANCDERLKNFGFDMTYDVLDDGFYKYLVDHKLIKPI